MVEEHMSEGVKELAMLQRSMDERAFLLSPLGMGRGGQVAVTCTSSWGPHRERQHNQRVTCARRHTLQAKELFRSLLWTGSSLLTAGFGTL